MSESAPAPRVNKAIMGQFMGRTVAVVGSLESWTGSSAVIKASDGGLVNVTTTPNSDYSRYMPLLAIVTTTSFVVSTSK